MEKRNYITSYRTPQSGMDKEASFDDEVVDKIKSELTEKAIEEDEKSDREHFKK